MKYDLSKPLDAKRATAYLSKLIEGGKVAEVREVRFPRSNEQNAYWHVCLGLIGEHCGYSLHQMKWIIKGYLEWMHEVIDGHMIPRSSTDLNTAEFSALVDFTREYGDQAGCYVLTPEEFKEHWRDFVKYLP